MGLAWPIRGAAEQERPMKPRRDQTPASESRTRLTGSHRRYLEVAGTNIEDLDRAMKNGALGAASEDEEDKTLPT
jgi:hypothetical protein